MVIKSSDCFEILRVINKMEIKKELINTIMEIIKVQTKAEKIQARLLNMAEAEGKEIREVVEENITIAEQFDDLNGEVQAKGLEMIFIIVENIPKAEQEVYKLLAKLNDCTVKDVKEWEGEKLIEAIKEIIFNEGFQRFFSSLMK